MVVVRRGGRVVVDVASADVVGGGVSIVGADGSELVGGGFVASDNSDTKSSAATGSALRVLPRLGTRTNRFSPSLTNCT